MMIDTRNQTTWKNDEGFLNIIFITGFIRNLEVKDDLIRFDIQPSITETFFNVIVYKNSLNVNVKNLLDGNPIKITARLAQNPKLEYPSLVLLPLKFSRPHIDEISATHLNQLLQLDEKEAITRSKDNLNLVYLTGYIYAKSIVNEKIVLLIWNSQYELFPVIIMGNHNAQIFNKLEMFMPVRINGKLMLTNDINHVPQVCIVTKKITLALIEKDIPKDEPTWLLIVQKKNHNH